MSRFQIMYYFIKKQGDIVNGPFDIGHIPGWEHRRLEEAAKQLGFNKTGI